ncbi:MAG: hypothetical protein ABSD31_04580 [Candidatus Binataceae bacterium]
MPISPSKAQTNHGREKTKSRRRSIVLLAVAAAFIVFVLYSLVMIEPVQVVNGHIERQGDRVFVQGVLKNSGSDLKAISVEVSYFDQRGKKLAEDKIRVEGLRHEAEVPFKTPARELTGASDFSIRLDRGRNAYGN